MKKMKKIFAALLTLAMVLGMSMTTFAAPSSIEIEISGAGNGATFEWLQVIQPNSEKETGWEFATEDIASDFYKALGTSTEQTAIWMLIGNVTPSASLPTGVNAATASQVAAAMANVKAGNYSLNKTGDGSTVVVRNAGVYYIEGSEDGYAYNPMAAYVSFRYTDGVPSELECEGVTAKRVPEGITKEASSAKDVTEINRTETYTVTPSIVPYIADNELAGAEYILTDTITGATYNVNASGKVELTVTIGENSPMIFYGDVTTIDGTQNKYSFTADLSSLLKNNQYANQTIVITYQATVKDVQVGNDVTLGDGTNDSKYGTSSETLYTATIGLVKYAADADNDNITDNEKLENAEFKVYKQDGGKKIYAVAENGKLTGWTESESAATKFTTDEEGKISLAGLGAGDYYFTETKAPEGYSKNTEDEVIHVGLPESDATATITPPAVNFFNDTLSALPGTGGIGTTIFTIGGCIIMIAAAGLFFASRRKENK